MNNIPQCGHMHLLTSSEWETLAQLFHYINVNAIWQNIILTHKNTKPEHFWVTFLKLVSTHGANKNICPTQSNLQDWK